MGTRNKHIAGPTHGPDTELPNSFLPSTKQHSNNIILGTDIPFGRHVTTRHDTTRRNKIPRRSRALCFARARRNGMNVLVCPLSDESINQFALQEPSLPYMGSFGSDALRNGSVLASENVSNTEWLVGC